MDQCKKARNKLVEWDAFETLAGFILCGSDGLPHDGEGIYKKSVQHVQACESCRSWLEGQVPQEEKSRLAKLEKYCCPVMYGAVEHKEQDELQVRLINFQGDPTWAVMNFDVVGGNLLISYCPWCGKKMPKTPFVDDADGSR